ncbi:hypothetical protein OH491_10300 [Termitidicoccus mucosus]|uniref:Sialate O-acetylesterase domain-containing protein n=1 Tax=Termitidicoccus mucosus TaxID=1184151 RepID=A0A178IHH5_9BACT|nr:hypothetical protein AW736_17040 [Opitutaceae bacterium TSB47]
MKTNPKKAGLFTLCGLALLAICPAPVNAADATPSAPARPGKASFRVLHSNDATNIVNCLWTQFPVRPPVKDKFIRDSVAEVAGHGIDVHMMQPGYGWVPWWQSEVLPMSEQAAWKKSKNIRLHYYETYILNGGDLMSVFVDECRKTGQQAFASFRMNDQHHIFAADNGKVPEPEFSRRAGICPFYVENPQWRIGDDGYADLPGQLSMDFAVPQVREYRLKQIRELVDKYDIDGLELDFVRHWALFNQRKTTSSQRAEILTSMVRQIREILDAKGARAGRYLWLGMRIPAYPWMHDPMGVNLSKLASEAGVGIINASAHYYTDAQMPIAELRKQLPDDVALYAELHYTGARGTDFDAGGGQMVSARRRCTPLQLCTTAYLARRRGADAVSTFNFQYYRAMYGKAASGFATTAEPPYEVFEKISDLDWLAQQPQHYFASGDNNPMRPEARKFPAQMKAGIAEKVFMDMTPPAGGWLADGKLRIQSRRSLGDSAWKARLNGVPLKSTEDVSAPYPEPYREGLGSPANYRAWVVPAGLLKDGENIFEFSYKGDLESVTFRYMDVLLPGVAAASALLPGKSDAIRPGTPFGNNAVLQAGMKVPVWGTASPGQRVAVSFAGQNKETTASDKGNWRLDLDPMPAGTSGNLVIGDKTFTNVVTGEVWFVGGQSNAAFSLKHATPNANAEIARASFPQIRVWTSKYTIAGTPQNFGEGEWRVCTPATAGDFTGMGYFFAKSLTAARDGVPVGIISCNRSGAPIFSMMPAQVFDRNQNARKVAANYAEQLEKFPQSTHLAKAVIWNGMIYPLSPYAMRGVLWNQGEADVRVAYAYESMLDDMVKCWRALWGRADLPFYVVQLANISNKGSYEPAGSLNWPLMREAQANARHIPNVWVSVGIDIGDLTNVPRDARHPKNKRELGERLVSLVQAGTYGIRDDTKPFASPFFEKAVIRGDKVICHFDAAAKGLKTRDGKSVGGFEIAGARGKFVPAEALIEGETIIVSSPSVKSPASVRYAWSNTCEGTNVVNASGLPLSPFRASKQ